MAILAHLGGCVIFLKKFDEPSNFSSCYLMQFLKPWMFIENMQSFQETSFSGKLLTGWSIIFPFKFLYVG